MFCTHSYYIACCSLPEKTSARTSIRTCLAYLAPNPHQIRIFLAAKYARRHGAAGQLQICFGLPLGGEGAVALDEAVGEDGVAVYVLDGGVAVLGLEGGEVGVVDDVVEAVGLVGLVHALDGVGDVDGVCPGVLLLDVCDFDARRSQEAAGEERRRCGGCG